MEAPFDLLTYVSLVGALLVVVKCYIGECHKTKAFLYDVAFAHAEQKEDGACSACVVVPSRRFFALQKRKIPVCERSHPSDEEGRRPLAFLYMNDTTHEEVSYEKVAVCIIGNGCFIERLQPQRAD